MTTYARIADGQIAEIFPPLQDEEGIAIPIHARFHADFIAQLVVYDADNPPALPQPEQPTVEQRIASLRCTVQAHLDAAAADLGYDDIKTAVTYADEPAVAKFQAEGQALRAWRSLVWAACYVRLEQWKAGALQEPDADQLIDSLPPFVAPAT